VWGGRERAFTRQPLAQNLNVSFNIKKVNIFLYIIANLAGNINNIETYYVNREGKETCCPQKAPKCVERSLIPLCFLNTSTSLCHSWGW
jgi:hypothetical protein